MNDYYVYGLFYGDDICFYIGKGTKYRLKEHLYEYERKKVENNHKRRKIKKLRRNGKEPYAKKIIFELTEDEAIEKETRLIKEIGIKNLTNHIIEDKKRVSTKGEKHYESKINKRDVKEIKWLVEHSNMKSESVQKKYGVNGVLDIHKGKTWKHVEGKTKPNWYNGVKYENYEKKKSAIYKKTRARKITEEDVKQIRWLYNKDGLAKNIASVYGVSNSYCYRLAAKKKRKSVNGTSRPPKEIVEKVL